MFDSWIVLMWSLKNGEVFWTHTFVSFFFVTLQDYLLLSAAVERVIVPIMQKILEKVFCSELIFF